MSLGLHFFVRGERLAALQWLGVLVAFIGLFLAVAEGFVLIRATRLGQATATKTLFYQLAVSALASLTYL